MATVTEQDRDGIYIVFDDEKGWYIEGLVPYVPEDRGPGWVCFELEPTLTKEQVASKLFLLGYRLDHTAQLLEDF